MRPYAKVVPQFWTGTTGRAIRAAGRDAQLVALYLITAPSSNMIGLYYLPLPTLCHEVGMSTQSARRALERLAELGFASYDAASEHVFVPEMARFQMEDSLKLGDKRIAGVINDLKAVRAPRFVREFYEKYASAFHLQNGFVSPLEAPSEDLRSQEQEQEHEQDQEQEQEKSDAGTPLPPAAGGMTGFDEFWREYPKKVDKVAAAKAWKKLSADAALVETIMAALVVQKASDDWRREGGRFIPNAARWLSGRRWEDQLTSRTGTSAARQRINDAWQGELPGEVRL